MNQKKSGRLTFTILSISLLTVMAGAAMAPALGVIREHFAQESSLMIQLIVSLPALFIILTNFFFPALCRRMKTKTLAVTGLCMYIIFGAGAFFAEDIRIVLAMRALLGVSVGMIMPLSTGLPAYYFPPEEQSRLMGLAAFMSQMGGVIATFLSGFLCALGWNFSFLVYLLGAVALVLVTAFLPNDRLSAEKKSTSTPQSRKQFTPLIVSMFLVMLLFFIFPTNFAITSPDNKSLTPETVTLIMVGLDIVAAAVGLVFGKMMKRHPRAMKYMAPVGFTLGYACFAMGTDLVWLLAGSIIVGIANGAGIPYLNTIASIKGGKGAATSVMPLLSAAMYLGQFASPLIVSPCASLLSGITAPYKVGAIIGALFILQTFCTRKHLTA